VFVSGGINYKPYKQAFRKIFNKEVFVIDSYLASEGFVAFQNRPDTSNMALVFQNGLFYEFIPFNSNNYDDAGNLRSGAQSLLINEIEPGVDYSLVLSTNSGAWRYQIGDLVRFNDVQKNEIIITGRTSHFLSIVGEHLSVGNMTEGILAIQEELGNSVKEFTVYPVQSGKFFAHRWYIGTDKMVDTTLLAIRLDAKLCEVNDDYCTERSAEALDKPQIQLIPNEWFYEFMSHIGKLNGQAKFPRVLKNEFLTEFEKFITAKGSHKVST